jgi:hypothetical protein
MLTDRFSIGFTAKFVQERIWNSTASGFAFDVGTLYRTPFNDLMIGASISNFGTSMKLDGRDIQFNSDPNENLILVLIMFNLFMILMHLICRSHLELAYR